eukprot:scaffold154250_cov19-Tisochrysis_lutea.AAC.3
MGVGAGGAGAVLIVAVRKWDFCGSTGARSATAAAACAAASSCGVELVGCCGVGWLWVMTWSCSC